MDEAVTAAWGSRRQLIQGGARDVESDEVESASDRRQVVAAVSATDVEPWEADHICVAGRSQAGEWDLDLTLETYPPLCEMRRRCEEFLPVLRRARLYAERPVRVGLRPARPGNVRLEREPGTRIVHNVGQGGSGVTLDRWHLVIGRDRLTGRPYRPALRSTSCTAPGAATVRARSWTAVRARRVPHPSPAAAAAWSGPSRSVRRPMGETAARDPLNRSFHSCEQ
jgi:hypothetical protein